MSAIFNHPPLHAFFIVLVVLPTLSLFVSTSVCSSSVHPSMHPPSDSLHIDFLLRVTSRLCSYSVTVKILFFPLTFFKVALTPVSTSPTGNEPFKGNNIQDLLWKVLPLMKTCSSSLILPFRDSLIIFNVNTCHFNVTFELPVCVMSGWKSCLFLTVPMCSRLQWLRLRFAF